MLLKYFAVLALVTATVVSGASDALGTALASISFNSALEGVTHNGDMYGRHSVSCYYLEIENVTCTSCSWGGACQLQTLGTTPPSSTCSASSPPHEGFDRTGEDFASNRADNFTECSSRCCGDSNCLSWVFVAKFQSPSTAGCDNGGGCCWLKNSVPAETPLNYTGGIWSGTTTQPTPPPIVVPPTGIRNAVPVGGLGAGTLELRGDGTFHEITIHSASPAGSAKYATQSDMLLATVINGVPSSARALRTSPPAYAAPGVASISYRGSYPASRLDIEDPTFAAAGLSASLFFYHHLVPGDSPTSSAPAAVFSLSITNNGASPANVSMLLQIPFGGMSDCRRVNAKYVMNSSQVSAAGCLSACASAPASESCAAWNFNAAGICELLSNAGPMVFELGSSCGVVGAWDSSTGTLGFAAHPSDPESEAGPAWGDIALSPVGGVGFSSSFAAGNAADLYASFAAGGGTFVSLPGVAAVGNFSNYAVIGGGVTITSPIIAPGDTVTISISFSWYFPNRDYYNSIVGQFYSTRFTSALDVSAMYTNDHLVEVATTAAVHTNVWTNKDTSMPTWLSDHMLNQFSHFRNFIYSRDGSMREHEANDCPDLDSVHNDYQRHLPYLWAVPSFEMQKSELYQACQETGVDAGMITENPGFNFGDNCGGRRMGDVTTIWILEVLEIWRGTNDTERLKAAWPAVVRGMEWQIRQSIDQGLPAHLVCTYDILGMEKYNTTTFNGVLHLAAMKAVTVMGTYLNDMSNVAVANAAFTRGLAAMTGPLMWNSTYNYFRAYTGGDAIMSDCLYGQQVALAHGLGWLLPIDMITSHLAAELKYNANPFGLTTVTGRKTPPPQVVDVNVGDGGDAIAIRKETKAADVGKYMNELRVGGDGQDDAVWMGAAPTWSCLMLALGAADPATLNITDALEPTRWELENYRTRLSSMWDLTGLSTTGDWGDDSSNGQPFCTSHYGFMLTDYYLPYTLSGQQTNLPSGTLSFAPLYSCPMNLPFGLVGGEGTVSCEASGTYTLSLAFGTLTLPAGGLSVNGKAYAGAVTLFGGQSVTW
jgi:non-lysosomal glucosylceramidase